MFSKKVKKVAPTPPRIPLQPRLSKLSAKVGISNCVAELNKNSSDSADSDHKENQNTLNISQSIYEVASSTLINSDCDKTLRDLDENFSDTEEKSFLNIFNPNHSQKLNQNFISTEKNLSKENTQDNFNTIPSILKLSQKSKSPNKKVSFIEEIIEKSYNLEDELIENSINTDHFDKVLINQLNYFNNIDQVLQNELKFNSTFSQQICYQRMESINRKLNENYKLVQDLPDDAKELPKFLASCKCLYKLINPVGDDEVEQVIDFLKRKLNSEIFITFQEKVFNNYEEFEASLKKHYLRKIPSYNFYMNIMSSKQKQNETVRSFMNRLTRKKNEFLQQNQPSQLDLNDILIQAFSNGLEPRLKIFAQMRDETSIDALVSKIENIECKLSTQSMINEVNVANLLLGASNEDTEELSKKVSKEKPNHEVNYFRDDYHRNQNSYRNQNFNNQRQFGNTYQYPSNSRNSNYNQKFHSGSNENWRFNSRTHNNYNQGFSHGNYQRPHYVDNRNSQYQNNQFKQQNYRKFENNSREFSRNNRFPPHQNSLNTNLQDNRRGNDSKPPQNHNENQKN